MRTKITNTLATAVPSICQRCESRVSRFQISRYFSSISQSLAPLNSHGRELEGELLGSDSGSANRDGLSPMARLSAQTRNRAAAASKDKDNDKDSSFAMMDSMSNLARNPYPERPTPYHLHVYAHKHNTHLTLTRPNRDPMMSLSCGVLGFRKSHRSGYDPAYQLSTYFMGKIQERGFLMDIKSLEVILRGYGPGREAFTKVLLGDEGKTIRNLVTQVTDATRLKFGGTRSRRVRRLG